MIMCVRSLSRVEPTEISCEEKIWCASDAVVIYCASFVIYAVMDDRPTRHTARESASGRIRGLILSASPYKVSLETVRWHSLLAFKGLGLTLTYRL